MKKKLVLVLLIVFAGFILYATIVSKVYHKEITITAPLLKIHEKISYIDYISKWYLPFANTAPVKIKTDKDNIVTDSASLKIIKLTGLSSLLQITEHGKSQEVLFALKDDAVTTVTLSYESTLWNKLFVSNPIITDAEKSLDALKYYIEDTKRIYGYSISLTEVTDTTFIFTSQVVANNSRKESLKKLYETLIQYSKDKNAGYNGTRIFYMMPAGNDSTKLYASIGIVNNIESMPITGPIALKRMPYKRKLVIADYKGKFADLPQLFTAMEQYRVDNSLTSMAIPFIKFTTEGIEFDDQQIIEGKGFFPVL